MRGKLYRRIVYLLYPVPNANQLPKCSDVSIWQAWVHELKLPSVDCSLYLTIGARHANAAAGSQGVRESGVCVLDLVATTCQCNVSVHGMAACRLPTALHIYIHTYMTAACRWDWEWEWVGDGAGKPLLPSAMHAGSRCARKTCSCIIVTAGRRTWRSADKDEIDRETRLVRIRCHTFATDTPKTYGINYKK